METIEKITIRCFFLGMAFVIIWFLLCAATGNWMYELHAQWFRMSIEQMQIIHYYGLMFTKVCIFIFFLIPYIACKWAGKKS